MRAGAGATCGCVVKVTRGRVATTSSAVFQPHCGQSLEGSAALLLLMLRRCVGAATEG